MATTPATIPDLERFFEWGGPFDRARGACPRMSFLPRVSRRWQLQATLLGSFPNGVRRVRVPGSGAESR